MHTLDIICITWDIDIFMNYPGKYWITLPIRFISFTYTITFIGSTESDLLTRVLQLKNIIPPIISRGYLLMPGTLPSCTQKNRQAPLFGKEVFG
jgi:hypothetical protein